MELGKMRNDGNLLLLGRDSSLKLKLGGEGLILLAITIIT
jgi:hypothetical protein